MTQWSIPLDQLASKAQADIDRVARVSTFLLFKAVVQGSPVDTGRFRANWNTNFGAPDYTVTESTADSRATAQIAAVLRMAVGGVVWLTNGLPYARRLEYGWSKQAPAGMVRLAAMRFGEFVRQAIVR